MTVEELAIRNIIQEAALRRAKGEDYMANWRGNPGGGVSEGAGNLSPGRQASVQEHRCNAEAARQTAQDANVGFRRILRAGD